MAAAVSKFWKARVGQAPVDRTIRGATTRGEQPIENVRVTAELRLRYSGSAHSLAATTFDRFRRYTYNATSDADGNYELKSLVKGTYLVTFTLPDGKTIQRKVSVIGKEPTRSELDTSR